MVKEIYIRELIPNNFYINELKLNRVREAYSTGQDNNLPPILVGIIDNEYSLIDGHSRTMAAFENGLETISANVYEIEKIEGPIGLYKAIHNKAKEIGLNSIEDLKDRILSDEEHKKLWVGYCEPLMEDLK